MAAAAWALRETPAHVALKRASAPDSQIVVAAAGATTAGAAGGAAAGAAAAAAVAAVAVAAVVAVAEAVAAAAAVDSRLGTVGKHCGTCHALTLGSYVCGVEKSCAALWLAWARKLPGTDAEPSVRLTAGGTQLRLAVAGGIAPPTPLKGDRGLKKTTDTKEFSA